VKRPVAALLFLVASPAWAQRTEFTLIAGYTTAGNIDQKAPSIQGLQIDHAFTWGFAAGRSFSSHLGAEVSWSRRESALALQTSSGRAHLFDLNEDQLLGNLVYAFGKAGSQLRPFLAAGLGATFFSARDLEGETKFSGAFGGGVLWSAPKRWGARLQARYAPTRLNDTSSDYCDPFGFCQGWLHQLELTAGVSLRF
jgi:hypothetical protein